MTVKELLEQLQKAIADDPNVESYKVETYGAGRWSSAAYIHPDSENKTLDIFD